MVAIVNQRLANLFLQPLQQKATVLPLESFAVIEGLALRSGLIGHIGLIPTDAAGEPFWIFEL